MAGPYPYFNGDLDYPAPGCLVTVSYDAHMREWPALLDSGADYTCVPIDLINEFALEKKGELPVEGATGDTPEMQDLYRVNLEFLGIVIGYHLVLGGTGLAAREHILIGRDILNRYHVRFAGPDLQFFIDETA